MDGRDGEKKSNDGGRKLRSRTETRSWEWLRLGVRRYHLAENISAGGRRPSSPARADPGPSAECDGEGIDGWMVLVLLVVLFIRAFFKLDSTAKRIAF